MIVSERRTTTLRMQLIALEVVESWHSAANARDIDRLCALASLDVEVVGPRGSARGHDALRQWLARGGLSAEPVRWFCGPRGRVVVEQRGRWFAPERVTVEDSGRWLIPDNDNERTVAAAFWLLGGRVVRYQRFDELREALTYVQLTDDDEVLPPTG